MIRVIKNSSLSTSKTEDVQSVLCAAGSRQDDNCESLESAGSLAGRGGYDVGVTLAPLQYFCVLPWARTNACREVQRFEYLPRFLSLDTC